MNMNILPNYRKEHLREDIRLLFHLILLFLSSRLLLVLVGCIYNYLTGDYSKTWDLLYHFDAEWYVDIIENGYQAIPRGDGQANYAFYPLYPMVVRFIKQFFPDSFTTNQIGIYVSNLCIFLASFVSVKLVRRLSDRDDGYFIAFLLFFAPHSMYFAMTYTESMFVLFTALFFYACHCKKFFLASICACLAALTRIVGVFLVFSLLFSLYQAEYGLQFNVKKIISFIKRIFLKPLYLLEILICPLGIFGYLYYLYRLTGDVWASAHIQVAWHHPYNSIFKAIYHNLLSPGSGASSQYWSLWAILGFAMILYLLYKGYYSYATFGFLSLIVPLNTDVLAASRYVMGNFVIYIALYEYFKNKQTAKIVLMNACILITAMLYYLWFSENCFFVF